MEIEISTKGKPLWQEAHLEIKSIKHYQSRHTFGSGDAEKIHALVAQSAVGSENVETPHVGTALGHSNIEKINAVAARSTL